MKPVWLSSLLAAVACAAVGCGYRVVSPGIGDGRRLAVPTAENDTRWRGIEADLTAALRRDAQRQLDVILSERDADLRLLVQIGEIGRQAPVRASSGGAELGAAALELRWRLVDAAGTELAAGVTQRSLEFRPDQAETASTALRELLDSMAEHVVIEVGSDLSSPPAPPLR